MLASQGAAPCTDPVTALRRLAGQALAMERAAAELVNALPSLR